MSDPSDSTGGDFGGGDDQRDPIPQPPPPPPPPNTSCYFTSATPEALTVNTYDSLIEQTYNFTANRGPTNSPISWSISPTTYGSTFIGSSDTEKSITLSFPQKSTGQGVFTVSISNQGGSASQASTYQITSSSSGGVSYWRLQSNQSIINTNNNGVVVNGTMTANRVLGVTYTDISGAPTSYWQLQTNQSMKNINTNGLKLSGNTIIDNKLIVHDGNIGWLYLITEAIGSSGAVRPVGTLIEGSTSYCYYKIVDSDGFIHWNNLKAIPSFVDPSSDGGKTVAALATVFGAIAAGTLAGGVVSWFWNKLKNTGVNVTRPEGASDRNSDGTSIGAEAWNTIRGRPIASSSQGSRYDIGIKGDFLMTSTANFYIESSLTSMVQDPDGSLIFFDVPFKNNLVFNASNKTFYGTFKAGNYELNENGLYYNGVPVVSGSTSTSSVRLENVADGFVSGTQSNPSGVTRSSGGLTESQLAAQKQRSAMRGF